MKFFAFFTVVLVLFASGAVAQSNLHCAIKGGEGRGWVPEDIFLSVDYDRKTALIIDPLIAHYEQNALTVPMKPRRNGIYRIDWSVFVSDARPSGIRVKYTLEFDPNANTVKVKGSFPLQNASNRIRGEGRCAPVRANQIPRGAG